MILDSAPETQWEPIQSELPSRLLIIDDDLEQCEVLSYRLTKQGFDVVVANSGVAGFDAARRLNPDAIILDIRLPDADGLDICQSLADSDQTSHIPVIIVSGCERPNMVRLARQAGSRYYVRKPYDPNALLLLIQEAISDY